MVGRAGDKYQVHARQKRLIQRAGARVLLPKLTAALGHWRTDWEVSEREKRQMTVEERFAKLEAAKEAAEAEAASLRIELKKAQQAMVDGSGREEELRNAHEVSMAAEREKRIEHAQHMAAMRIIKKDLVLGWTCWHEKWSAYARKRRLLQGAASRLAKPKLVACVHVWRKDWEVTMARKAKLSHKEQLVQSENLAASLQREVAQLKARLIEIGGKHEQERQAERERRIEQVGQMAMLRIVKKDLALGWTTWYGSVRGKARSKRLLQGAAGRIAKPKLAAAVSWWRRDYLAASSMSHTEMVASEKSMRIAAEAEANRLREELKQARQAALDGTGREKELARQHEAKMEEEREKRIEHAQHMAAMRIVKKELVLGWTTWHDQWEGQASVQSVLLRGRVHG